jgi:hypothetical protein
MADIRFCCPHCQQSLEAPYEMLGQQINCPSCTGAINLPDPQPKQPPPPLAQTPPQKPTIADTHPCPCCGEQILRTASKCKHCGAFLNGGRPAPAQDGTDKLLYFEARKKSAATAAILNLVIPGLGYMYCGNIILGIVVFFLVVGLAVFTLGISLFVSTPVMIIDGVLAAGRANRNLAQRLTGK